MSEKNEKCEDTNNDHNSLPSQHAVAGNNLLRSSVLRPSVLRSSVLNSATNHSEQMSSLDSYKEYTNVNDEMFSNPFMKEQKDDENVEGGAVGGDIAKNNDVDTNDKSKPDDDDEIDERPDPLTLLRKNGLERANLFAAAKNSIPRVEKSGFVFGQNVHERVVVDNIKSDCTITQKNSNSAPTSGELLFSSVVQNAAKATETDASGAVKDTDVKTLTDVAREYEESRAQKRKYEEVETFTGEENEVNIIDINCKLFAFVNSNWEERGRGSLRLNDSKNEQECSRVVFRTSGNLRVLLNTKVWNGMVAERPSQKSLRLTAMDNTGKIKIFLLMARPIGINQLHKSLVERIDKRKASHPEEYHTAVADNNPEETKKCSSLDVDGQVEAASELDHEDSTEPRPKKPSVADLNH